MAKLYVNSKHQMGHLNPELQGHFSEHLGRCIYEGLYVGEDSEIPNRNGMRTDVVKALKEMQDKGDWSELMVVSEELKTLPFGDVWAEYCKECGAPLDGEWFAQIKNYENNVLAKRV